MKCGFGVLKTEYKMLSVTDNQLFILLACIQCIFYVSYFLYYNIRIVMLYFVFQSEKY